MTRGFKPQFRLNLDLVTSHRPRQKFMSPSTRQASLKVGLARWCWIMVIMLLHDFCMHCHYDANVMCFFVWSNVFLSIISAWYTCMIKCIHKCTGYSRPLVEHTSVEVWTCGLLDFQLSLTGARRFCQSNMSRPFKRNPQKCSRKYALSQALFTRNWYSQSMS